MNETQIAILKLLEEKGTATMEDLVAVAGEDAYEARDFLVSKGLIGTMKPGGIHIMYYVTPKGKAGLS